MLAPLLLLLAGVSPSPVASQDDDPPVRAWLSSDGTFARGDRARVHVRAAEDGYLVVLRSDAGGSIRVLFPLDPGDDNFVRGGERLEIRGRGDREAFFVDERDGVGRVVAAYSSAPFRFDDFLRGDHWDSRALRMQEAGGDAEAALLDVVERMAGGARFEYDVATYSVFAPGYRRTYAGYYDPFYYGYPYRFRFSLAFGYPYRYRSYYYNPFFYDPFFYDPFFYDPFSHDPFCGFSRFCYGYGGSRVFIGYYRPVLGGGGGHVFRNRLRTPGGGFVIPRDRERVTAIVPRPRAPENVGGGLRRTVASRLSERADRPRVRGGGGDRLAARERRRSEARPAAPRWREQSWRQTERARTPVISGGDRRAPSTRAWGGGRSSGGGSRMTPRSGGVRRR